MFSLSWLGQNDLHPPRASQDNLIYYLISECSPVRLRITVDGAVYGCGGSIIDEKNILTAAHCRGHGNVFVESIIVYAGDHNREKSDGESKYEVCGWTWHPKVKKNQIKELVQTSPSSISVSPSPLEKASLIFL